MIDFVRVADGADIVFKNVTKKYGNFAVYENFDFTIKRGAITCILGESGSGKTTLLNMIAGLTPYEGNITPALKCSYVFQEPRLVPNLTVRGNLSLVCKDKRRTDEMLAVVELTEKAESYPVSLSGGQSQRVAVARAFLYPSDLILLDEPFSSLDLALKLKISAQFLKLWQREKRTAVFVTHNADEALMLANRIVVLKGGKVVKEFYPEGSPSADLFARQGMRSELIKALLSD